MKPIKTAFWSLVMCLGILGIIVLTSWVMHKLFGFTHDLQSFTFNDNPVDACVAMIEKLHELNLL